jgi:hypothetical protein
VCKIVLRYARACYQFFHWCQETGLTLDTVRPFHVAAYIEQMPGSKPTVKQKLAAIRMLYLENGGRLEHARQMAAHESPRPTKLYDRTKDEITIGEIERIQL